MVRLSRVRLAAVLMCHPQVIRSRQWMRHNGGNALIYQNYREGLKVLPLNPLECEIFKAGSPTREHKTTESKKSVGGSAKKKMGGPADVEAAQRMYTYITSSMQKRGGRSWASLTGSATCDPSASRRSP